MHNPVALLKNLGMEATDKVTGFQGTITSVCFDLYGCIQCVLTPPKNKSGDLPDGGWFDMGRLVIGKKRTMEAPAFIDEKGPADKPPMRTHTR